MKTTPLTVIFILLTLTTSFASISGTVTDYSTGNPLANVHVTCSNNENTHTDNHGFYEFENPSYGVFDFTFTKTGYESFTKEKVYVGNQTQLDVQLHPPCLLEIITKTLPTAQKGEYYNQHIYLNCGTEPFDFQLVSGKLPPDLTLDRNTGNIMGIPQTTGGFTFSVGVSDALENYAESEFTLTVISPIIISDTSPLPAGTKWHDFFYGFNIQGGTSHYLFELVAGALPSGISLNENGSISGLPLETGNSYFTIQVTDSTDVSEQKNFSLEILSPLLIEKIQPPHGLVGETYHLVLEASGGLAPYEWEIYSGHLPSGLRLEESSGTLLGIPQETTYGTIVFSVTDAHGRVDFLDCILQVLEPLEIVTAHLPNAFKNKAYSELIQIKGGIGPYIFNYAGTLPDGLKLNASKGILYGTPLESVVKNIKITVSDSSYPVSQSDEREFRIRTTGNLTILTSTIFPGAQKGRPINDIMLKAAGGISPYTWSITDGALPQGIQLNSVSGIISGTSLDKGDVAITIKVTDQNSQTFEKEFLWHIDDDLSIISGNVPDAVKNMRFNYTLQAEGGQKPYYWRIKSGSLLSGLSFNNDTGTIDGTPVNAGEKRDFTVQLVDSASPPQTCDQRYFMQVIHDDLYIFTSELPNKQIFEVYNETIRASLGNPPYEWRLISGALPQGLELISSPSVAQIKGTPTFQDQYSFTLEVSDASLPKKVATQTYDIQIYGGMIITTQQLNKACQDKPYYDGIAVNNGSLPYRWSIVAGNLPSGINLNPDNGSISGVSSLLPGQHTFFTIKVTDASIPQASIEKEFVIYGMNCSLEISPEQLPMGMQKLLYQADLDATGGIAPYHWFLAGGNLPEGLSLNADTGIIYGKPLVCGGFEFIVAMEDAASGGASKSCQLEILCSNNYEISGKITDFNGPLKNVSLALQGNDEKVTLSDDSGFYRFENLTNGTYTIIPEMGRYHFTPESAVITLKNCDAFGVDFSGQFYTNPPQRPSNPNPSNFANTIPLNPQFSWTCNDPDNDTLSYDFYMGKTQQAVLMAQNIDKTVFSPDLIEPATTYYWKILARDQHGAETMGPTWQFTTMEKADLTPPVAPSSLYATPDKKQWTAQNRIQMSWQQSADPDGSGLAGYSYVWDTRAFTTPDTTVDTRLLQIFSPVLGDGNNHYFHIRAIDNAGNASNAKHFGPFYIDTTPPQKGSILINDGLDETDFSQVTLTLFAEDTLSGLKYMVFSNDNNTWGPAQDFQERISYDLSSGKGEKQVYVKFSDASENWTQAVIKDSIVFGLTKPAKPQNLKAESLDATIILSWDEINQATYAVLKSESQTGFFYPVNDFEINHSHVMNNRVYFTDTHVTNHSDNYYKVFATIDGIHSEPSEIMHATAQNKYTFDLSVIDPVKMINIGSMARYYIQVHSGDEFKGKIHLTVSGLDSALARSFVMDGNNLGASISDLAPPALVILEITAGSAAPVQEHQFEITAQNVWTSGSSDFYHVPSSLIIRPRASSGIHAEVEKARIHKGEQVQIYGSIIPSLADKSVKIHLNNQVIETYTLQGGGFVDTTTIGTLPIGQYEFNASFIDNQSDMHESIKRQFTITKGISTLTCLRESAEIPTDDSPFNIYGILFPHMPNENVIIRVIDPSQHHTDHVVRTDMNGHYTFTQDAFTQTGEWAFKAYWMGNDQYIGCESALITIPFGIDIGRVIILAGGEVQNNAYWDVTEKLTTDAYRAFKANGFSDEMIHYIINTDTIDINNDGKSDNVVDDYLPTINGFTHAIGSEFSNVLDHDTPLYVYMQGHATNEKAFKVLGDDQTITSQEIKNVLDDIQETNNCTVVLLLESCYSGLFISDLQATNRVILTSADDQAYQTDASGQISFSKFLFSSLSRGDSLKRAFDRARMRMLNLGYPSPQISDPSEISRHIYLGGMLSWAQTSRIESIDLPEVIKDKSYCPITVKADETIKNVWVKTIRPDMRLSDSQSLIQYPEYDLSVNNQTGYFEGTLHHLNVPGVYKILTFVENYDHIVSDPIIQYLSVDVLTKIQGDINENGVIDLEDVLQVIKKVTD